MKQHAEKIVIAPIVAGILGAINLSSRMTAAEVEIENLKETSRYFHGEAGPGK